jgi:NAD(P)H-dependent FMN reductase
MLKIAIVIGSTRVGRRGDAVARWIFAQTDGRGAQYEILDIAAFDLALLGEDASERTGATESEARWADAISKFDGYVLICPEYNHAPNAALKNALDLGGPGWANKAVAFVGYGGFGGVRAVEMLRLVATSLELAGVKAQVALTLSSDFTEGGELTPRPHQVESVDVMLNQLASWASAMRDVRVGARRAAA